MIPIITIDGPSGAGKGTVCRLVSQQTGFHLLDSGALYRLTALACMNQSLNLDDENLVTDVAQHLSVEFQPLDSSTKILLSKEDVTHLIRDERVGMAASKVAAYPKVRVALLERQRNFAQSPGLVADGRDMGTVVFPSAKTKIFLTASSEERAKRRVLQLEGSGAVNINFDKILSDIEKRDEQDRTRAEAPLIPADDALLIDSTNLSIGEVVARVLAAIN